MLATWDTTGRSTGTYTIRLIVLDTSANIVIFDMQIEIVAEVNLEGIPDAVLDQDESIEDFVHLPDYASAASGDVETFTYTIVGNTAPDCGVTIDGSNNIDINPTSGWSGTSTVTVEVSNGPPSDTDSFTVTVNSRPALLVAALPSTAWPGHVLNVAVYGANTHWGGTSQVSFGQGILVDAVNVASATQLTATISISWDAITGPRDVTVTTGSEVVVGTDLFVLTERGIVPRPEGLAATAGAQAVYLEWLPCEAWYVTGYNVYRDTELNGSYTDILNGSPVGGTTYTDSSVTPGALITTSSAEVGLVSVSQFNGSSTLTLSPPPSQLTNARAGVLHNAKTIKLTINFLISNSS